MSELRTKLIVGMEIHVQVRTASKLFCACPVVYDAPPNSAVCPVCLGHPGTLPVMNRRAVEQAALVGMALNCTIARFTKWDRKSYFYPDLPKNYQISQYDLPIARDGGFEFPDPTAFGAAPPGSSRVRIRRAHLEEDAGKNLHDRGDGSLIDLNRAGTPLIEIVTEPDLHSAEACYAFAVELQRLMRHLGVSDGVMQRGQMRFEPNVNVAIESDGREIRTPIAEIKNLNSFKAIRNAVEYEHARQTAQWRGDPEYVYGRRPNENRGWNDARGVTEYQRPKEAAHDYRYFPDPDLAPATFDDAKLAAIRARLPELPAARTRRLVDRLGLSPSDAETIVDDRATADLFDEAVRAGAPADVLARQMVNVWASLANERGTTPAGLGVDARAMAELAQMVRSGTVSATAAAQIAAAMIPPADPPPADPPPPTAAPRAAAEARSPHALAAKLGLIQEKDAGATQAWVDEAFRLNEQAVRDARSNPKKARQAAGFLRGQVMKLSEGRADPTLVGELIEKKLAEPT
ncbi:MAG: Aspartyl/glutamyl-tRNA(Asn/Gln) amidotransferase subunit B [Phycisphaerae bacterium]|nr:Aspartyl/glutamyl-tRNA(Asn/Gln) amidotransferase subunit B [Phycisphaerae bacterium]